LGVGTATPGTRRSAQARRAVCAGHPTGSTSNQSTRANMIGQQNEQSEKQTKRTESSLEELYRTYFFAQQYAWMEKINSESNVIGCITADGLHMGTSAKSHPEGRTPLVKVLVSSFERVADVHMRSAHTFGQKVLNLISKGKKVIWAPVRLIFLHEMHANALYIDARRKKIVIYHFEPHGWNLSLEQHGKFKDYYTQLEHSMHNYLCAALHGIVEFTFVAACSWLPEVFIQSHTQDPFCAFHCLHFLVEATKTSPAEYLQNMKRRIESGCEMEHYMDYFQELIKHQSDSLFSTFVLPVVQEAKRRRPAVLRPLEFQRVVQEKKSRKKPRWYYEELSDSVESRLEQVNEIAEKRNRSAPSILPRVFTTPSVKVEKTQIVLFPTHNLTKPLLELVNDERTQTFLFEREHLPPCPVESLQFPMVSKYVFAFFKSRGWNLKLGVCGEDVEMVERIFGPKVDIDRVHAFVRAQVIRDKRTKVKVGRVKEKTMKASNALMTISRDELTQEYCLTHHSLLPPEDELSIVDGQSWVWSYIHAHHLLHHETINCDSSLKKLSGLESFQKKDVFEIVKMNLNVNGRAFKSLKSVSRNRVKVADRTIQKEEFMSDVLKEIVNDGHALMHLLERDGTPIPKRVTFLPRDGVRVHVWAYIYARELFRGGRVQCDDLLRQFVGSQTCAVGDVFLCLNEHWRDGSVSDPVAYSKHVTQNVTEREESVSKVSSSYGTKKQFQDGDSSDYVNLSDGEPDSDLAPLKRLRKIPKLRTGIDEQERLAVEIEKDLKGFPPKRVHVARLAGVSHSTVSKFLKGKSIVSAEAVIKAIERLGFVDEATDSKSTPPMKPDYVEKPRVYRRKTSINNAMNVILDESEPEPTPEEPTELMVPDTPTAPDTPKAVNDTVVMISPGESVKKRVRSTRKLTL
jgi:hypothetical protein